ncbi:MAG: tetraacyldisaccharide 4'-kinase [Caulobacter sp.]|nr:tetraacyldisaccharide 4'-kinase [Caulobacter sp.]
MKLATPRWWYVRDGAPGVVARMLLTPISWIWAAVTARRIARTTPVDPGVPVICVGNFTAGGVGKTPVVRELLALLRAQGLSAHGLSRGYGGRLAGPIRVDPRGHTAADVGDEPLMLSQDGPFWIARDRLAGARAAAGEGASVVVMDDGHQNPSVKKALSLVVVDGETRNNEWPFGDGAVFPAGPMREPLKASLARTDAVILMLPADLAEPDPDLVALFPGKPVLIARLEPAAPPPPGPQVAFAGIGKPWKVERSLVAAGCDLKDFAPFPDHGAYDEATLKALERRAADFGAGLLTTEKDWARLPPAWREKIAFWPVRARFEDEAAVQALLARVFS